jgi:hypothetical protein
MSNIRRVIVVLPCPSQPVCTYPAAANNLH